MEQVGFKWIKEFLAEAEPTMCFDGPDILDERNLKIFDLTKGLQFMYLALNIHPNCWLFHRQQSVAKDRAIRRYIQLGKPLRYFTIESDLSREGYYEKIGNYIRTRTVQEENGEFCFIPTPRKNILRFRFIGNWKADAQFECLDTGETFNLIRRFMQKYPSVFALGFVTPAISIEHDGISPHFSL